MAIVRTTDPTDEAVVQHGFEILHFAAGQTQPTWGVDMQRLTVWTQTTPIRSRGYGELPINWIA